MGRAIVSEAHLLSLSLSPSQICPFQCSAHKASYTKVCFLTRSLSELAGTGFANHPLEGFCHRSDFHKKHTRPIMIRRPALQELQIFICKIYNFLINLTKDTLKWPVSSEKRREVYKYPPTVTRAIIFSDKILKSLALEVRLTGVYGFSGQIKRLPFPLHPVKIQLGNLRVFWSE